MLRMVSHLSLFLRQGYCFGSEMDNTWLYFCFPSKHSLTPRETKFQLGQATLPLKMHGRAIFFDQSHLHYQNHKEDVKSHHKPSKLPVTVQSAHLFSIPNSHRLIMWLGMSLKKAISFDLSVYIPLHLRAWLWWNLCSYYQISYGLDIC